MKDTIQTAQSQFLGVWPLRLFLSTTEVADYLEGKCSLREHDGVVIVDYTKGFYSPDR